MDSALGVVFPGQGSQSVGMLTELADAYPSVVEHFERASEVLGYDLWQIVQSGPADTLDATTVTQPAMLVAGVAVWDVWRRAGGSEASVMAGHSLGEYTALVCAGALAFDDAVGLVAERARLMQEAVAPGEGAMAAVLGLDDEVIGRLCEQAAQGAVVTPANYNAPGQVVVAGHDAAVERLTSLAKEAGAKRVVRLPVSVPSHCALMGPAAEGLAQRLAEVQLVAPRIPVIHNTDVTSHADVDELRTALTRQLDHPVRWVELVQAMKARGVERILESGPGKVLAGLNRRIDRRMAADAVFDPASLDAALQATADRISQ